MIVVFPRVCSLYIVINICFDGLAGWRILIPNSSFIMQHFHSNSLQRSYMYSMFLQFKLAHIQSNSPHPSGQSRS